MASPLSGLAKTIGGAMAGVFYDATLTRDVATPGPNAWTPGAMVPTDYPCKVLPDTWGAYSLSGGLVAAQDAKLLVLASTLAVEPKEGDRVTVQGATYTISSDGGSRPAVGTDPARAVWELRARK